MGLEYLGDWFPALLQLPAIIADLVAIGILYKYWLPKSRRTALTAAAAYAMALITILISAYHGNTDTIYAIALLASAILLGKDRGLQPVSSLRLPSTSNWPPISPDLPC